MNDMTKYSINWSISTLIIAWTVTFFSNCSWKEKPLPILNKQVEKNGALVYRKIPAFSFINQDSQIVTPATFADKAYVVDFFFTSCPTICPTLAQQMLRIHDRFKAEPGLLLLSHTIDPKRDSVAKLAHYAANLGVSSDRWHFVTGDKEEIFAIADDYFNIVIEDQDVPEGLDHSGRLVLVDQQKHIRAFCNGTDPEEVDQFMVKIEQLLTEQKKVD